MEEQSRMAEQAATATTQMSQTVMDVAGNAHGMANSADNALTVARQGAEVVRKTVEEVHLISGAVSESAQFMTSLGGRSRQIGEIVGVINDIADQTNLLALNAAIEAARAGEQGRGFAVVADEVRKLAERTAKATTEIGVMIKAIQEETRKAVSSMNESMERVELGADLSNQAGRALEDIVRSVNELQEMVQHIASATEEMSTTSETISSDIESIASASKQTSRSSNEITEASSLLARLASELTEAAGNFKVS
jgi:methyl-accepting chemotaxis protein